MKKKRNDRSVGKKFADRSVGEELMEEIDKTSPIPTYGFLAMFLTS